VDEPPPSQVYSDRATTFAALVPLTESHFYSQGVQRRLLIVLTDGESSQVSPLLNLTLHRRVPTVLVHVWAPGERILSSRGRPDPRAMSGRVPAQLVVFGSVPKRTSAASLTRAATRAWVRHARTECMGPETLT